MGSRFAIIPSALRKRSPWSIAISGGRVISGFVRGIGREYFGMGVDPTRSRQRFLEAHDLIIKAWTEEGPFHWVSENYEIRYVNPWPKPIQQPHPPIWIPAFGSVETIRWVAEKRYTYLSVYAPQRLIKRWFDQLREALLAVDYEAPSEMMASCYLSTWRTRTRSHESRPSNTSAGSLRKGSR